jgi:signal transduction histidine kinase
LQIQDGLPIVLADPERIERVILNLISNALKYSERDTLVEVNVQRQDEDLVVSVRDQGRGIATDQLPRLFQRFQRIQGTSGTEGIGLGLYISRVLVEAHDGKIWVESKVGKGSTFSFSLPVV